MLVPLEDARVHLLRDVLAQRVALAENVLEGRDHALARRVADVRDAVLQGSSGVRILHLEGGPVQGVGPLVVPEMLLVGGAGLAADRGGAHGRHRERGEARLRGGRGRRGGLRGDGRAVDPVQEGVGVLAGALLAELLLLAHLHHVDGARRGPQRGLAGGAEHVPPRGVARRPVQRVLQGGGLAPGVVPLLGLGRGRGGKRGGLGLPLLLGARRPLGGTVRRRECVVQRVDAAQEALLLVARAGTVPLRHLLQVLV
mmetsp:Transcript_57784/g.152003  ORF Transcript_57784/g.152003 Transcript_57784/m.152003 type:complete len:256 (+) Transcript_57784:492-1259(+)